MVRNSSQSLDGNVPKPDARQAILAYDNEVEAQGEHYGIKEHIK